MSTVQVSDAPASRDLSGLGPIPMTRIADVELRKMFDTRSGFWLLAGIAISALVASIAVIAFAPARSITYGSFATAIGVPIGVILPVVAILSVTSEWSQRTGLTTFTLLPHRSRVVFAKLMVSVAVAVVSVLVAFAIGALGNVIGAAIRGVDLSWDVSGSQYYGIVLANVLSLLVGFMLGVLIRNSAGAIVAYFIYSFVLPGLFGLLAASQSWFRSLEPWVDFRFAQNALYDGGLTGEQWGHLGVTAVIWLVVPMIVGVRLLLRSEVK